MEDRRLYVVKKLRQVLAAKITTPSPNKRFFALFLDGDDNDEDNGEEDTGDDESDDESDDD